MIEMYGEAIREEVRNLAYSGVPKAEIRRRLGIKSRSTIYNILMGEDVSIGVKERRTENRTQLTQKKSPIDELIEFYAKMQTLKMFRNLNNDVEQKSNNIEPKQQSKSDIRIFLEELKEIRDFWEKSEEQKDDEINMSDMLAFATANAVITISSKVSIIQQQMIQQQKEVNQQRTEFDEKLHYRNFLQQIENIKASIKN